VKSSWSSGALEALAGPLAFSLCLHLGAGAAYDALPSRLRAAAAPQLGQQHGARRLQVALHSAPPAPAPPVAPAPAVPVAVAPASSPGGAPEAPPPARYFLARELDARPVPLAPINPAYPNDAYLRNIAGSVLVRLHIAETGSVEQAEILRASPPGYFEEAVRRAFLTARFSPGMRAGRPVRVQLTLEVRYDGPPLEVPAGAVPLPAR